MDFNKEKYQKYLPSKKFTLIISSVIVSFVVIFLLFFMSSSGEDFSTTKNKKNNTALRTENQTLTELIQNDTDGDGIADWEEALWGTDKNNKMTFENMPDSTYIKNRKKELKTKENQSVAEIKLTETDEFAREFFVSYTAMKSSGKFSNKDINDFSSTLGEKIANSELVDQYSEKDIIIYNDDSFILKQKYYEAVQGLFKKHKSAGIGEEVEILSQKLTTNTNNNNLYDKLSVIANAYQNFAKKTIEIRVPKDLAQYHLQIINNSNNTGISILNMEKITNDPIIGLSGLSQYQKYSDNLIKIVEELEIYLKNVAQR